MRARLYLQGGKRPEALQDAEKALELDADSADAMIVRADIARVSRDIATAKEWYLRFIAAAPSDARKSNGYAYLARACTDALYDHPGERFALIAQATEAHDAAVRLDPRSVGKLVNCASFLNNEAANFDAAEQYARMALALRDIPAAPRHVALAQYQKLAARLGVMSDQALVDAVGKISSTTSFSIELVAQASGTGGAALVRLQPLRTRLAGSGLHQPQPAR